MITRSTKLLLVAFLVTPLLWAAVLEFGYHHFAPVGPLWMYVPEWVYVATIGVFLAVGSFAVLALLKDRRLLARCLFVAAYSIGMWWVLMFVGLGVACGNGDCI
jgi:hypothetical protein